MNKYAFENLAGLLNDLKHDRSEATTAKIQTVLQNEISEIPCVGVVINNSIRAGAYYGMIVFPKVVISEKDRGFSIKNYAVEFQEQILNLLSGEQLAAMLVHDISHNVLTNTVIERLKASIYNACKMTNMKVIDIVYNMDNKMRDIAVLDIANRSHKEPVFPGTDMYEADRILVDLEIYNHFNAALNVINSDTETGDMTSHMTQNMADDYMALNILKMVKEKFKDINRTYTWLNAYIKRVYDTRIFGLYPTIEIEMKEELFGQRVSELERLKPMELKYLRETADDIEMTDIQETAMVSGTLNFLRNKIGTDEMSLVLESIFTPTRPKPVSLQKEYDIVTYRMQNVGSNYERLAILERIYDTIYTLDRYLHHHPDDEVMKSFMGKFIELPQTLKDIKPTKKQYGVFVEFPAGYEG